MKIVTLACLIVIQVGLVLRPANAQTRHTISVSAGPQKSGLHVPGGFYNQREIKGLTEPAPPDGLTARFSIGKAGNIRYEFRLLPKFFVGVAANYCTFTQVYDFRSFFFEDECLAGSHMTQTKLKYNIAVEFITIPITIRYQLPYKTRLKFSIYGGAGPFYFQKIEDNLDMLYSCQPLWPNITQKTSKKGISIQAGFFGNYPLGDKFSIQSGLSCNYSVSKFFLDQKKFKSTSMYKHFIYGVPGYISNARWYSIGPSLGLAYQFGK